MNSIKNGKFNSNNELERHAAKIFPYATTICSIPFIQKCEFVSYMCGQKGKTSTTNLLIVKALEFLIFCECQSKWPIARKTLHFRIHSQLINVESEYV